MPPEEVTLGELARSLTALESRLDKKFADVNRRLDTLEFVPRREFEIHVAALTEDVRELRDSKTWMARGLVTSLLLPVLVTIIAAVLVTR
jgi:hypothetical protein